jgi:hypothetical protein
MSIRLALLVITVQKTVLSQLHAQYTPIPPPLVPQALELVSIVHLVHIPISLVHLAFLNASTVARAFTAQQILLLQPNARLVPIAHLALQIQSHAQQVLIL